MFGEPDIAVEYVGPQADFVSFTGSPIWGYSVPEVISYAVDRGWEHHFSERLPTPYGLSPLVNHFTTASGRSVFWIPSYGEVVGEDSLLHRNFERAYWILWKAGVKAMLVGGTSGVAEWRTGDDAIRPGDVVLPWSFYTRWVHRGLPGTPFESTCSKGHLLLGDPFCPEGAAALADRFQVFTEAGMVRRVRTPADTRVALVVPESITFETEFDILHWMATSKIASDLQPDRPPVVTLHGDCLNPILARYLGIHVLYYHMVSNYAQGLVPQEETARDIHHLYTKVFPSIALDIEFNLLDTLEIPSGARCKCTSSFHKAPPVFSQALTQPE
jgi:purine nucleoside phosphorylase